MNSVLVVDDEVVVRRALQKTFEKNGFKVFVAEDGPTGLVAWRAHKPDLVVLDVLMPGLTGPQVLDEIGAHSSKVVLISAYSGEYDLEKAKKLGADIFIEKPFSDIFAVVDQMRGLLSE